MNKASLTAFARIYRAVSRYTKTPIQVLGSGIIPGEHQFVSSIYGGGVLLRFDACPGGLAVGLRLPKCSGRGYVCLRGEELIDSVLAYPSGRVVISAGMSDHYSWQDDRTGSSAALYLEDPAITVDAGESFRFGPTYRDLEFVNLKPLIDLATATKNPMISNTLARVPENGQISWIGVDGYSAARMIASSGFQDIDLGIDVEMLKGLPDLPAQLGFCEKFVWMEYGDLLIRLPKLPYNPGFREALKYFRPLSEDAQTFTLEGSALVGVLKGPGMKANVVTFDADGGISFGSGIYAGVPMEWSRALSGVSLAPKRLLETLKRHRKLHGNLGLRITRDPSDPESALLCAPISGPVSQVLLPMA